MKITLDKVVAGAEGSLGGRDPGLSGIPAFEGCSLNNDDCIDIPIQSRYSLFTAMDFLFNYFLHNALIGG